MELIDSHTHLTAPDFDIDREAVIERAIAAGVSTLITIGAGYGIESARAAVQAAERYGSVYATVGVHPHDATTEPQLEELRDLARHPKVVAIGETGLDFYRNLAPVDLQRRWFKAQIEFARETGKPLIIHSREAGADCLATLREYGAAEVGGVFHCYAEDAAFAQRLAEINFLVSFPGSLTFKRATALRETAREIPLAQIMLETDAPYIAPEPHRGRRCESSFMVETAKQLATVKGMSLEDVAATTSATARRFYRLPPLVPAHGTA